MNESNECAIRKQRVWLKPKSTVKEAKNAVSISGGSEGVTVNVRIGLTIL
jgi:hypothetical protein